MMSIWNQGGSWFQTLSQRFSVCHRIEYCCVWFRCLLRRCSTKAIESEVRSINIVPSTALLLNELSSKMTQPSDANVIRGNPLKGMAQQMGKAFGKVFSAGKITEKHDAGTVDQVSAAFSALGAEIVGEGHNGHQQATHQHQAFNAQQSHHVDHGSDNQKNQHNSHGSHGQYQMSPYFEKAVEIINTAAGIIVMASVILAGINLILVAINANFRKSNILPSLPFRFLPFCSFSPKAVKKFHNKEEDTRIE